MELRPYQQAAVDAVYEHLRSRENNPCVVLPTGTGKSLCLAQIAKDAVTQWSGRVLILAHVKELLEQNADKLRKLAPELKIGVYSAGLNRRDTGEQVIVAGIQSVYDKACELGAFDLVIVDECFPAGTLIDTPRGQIPIENLYVGQPVRHALGVGNIEAISSRPAFEIMQLELSNGRTIECTPNHPFFTESGWLAASSLAVGARLFSREDVSGLRQGISSERMVRSEWETDPESSGNRLESADMLFQCLRQAVDSHKMYGEKSTDTGCGNPASPSRNTTGRREPLREENPQNGQADSCLDGGIRVVSVTHIKLESPQTVYNLQVAGHPSYYADGVLVHNCHLIAPDGDGMYRSFLKDMKIINPNVRLIGLTATPFRLKGGMICQPENLLNEVCYEAGLKEMITQGYLSPLVSRAGRAQAKLDGLHIRGGEFLNDEIAAAMDNTEIVTSACREIVELTRERKSVLIFTSSVEHCQHVAEKIAAFSGEECAMVTGATPAVERAELIARFKGEKVPDDFFSYKPPLKFLSNVNVLTIGFDAPNTDCVVLLRPTNSAGLLVQMCGRGTRLSPATRKVNCLILDFGENILRHGPLDMIQVKDKTPGKGDAPAKKCPECLALIHAAYQKCPECGYDFPPPEQSNLSRTASNAGVISGEIGYSDYEVQAVFYSIHEKRGADPDTPRTLRVDYQVGFNEFKSEWICPEHSGYAREKFINWWRARAAIGCPIPATAREAATLASEGLLAEPEAITVKTVAGEKFERVTGWRLKSRPTLPEGWPSPDGSDRQNHQTEEFDDDEIPF